MTCEKCGEHVNPNSPGWAQWVSGWEMKCRSGGTNQIMAPVRDQRFLCASCVVRLRTFGEEDHDQESLL